MKTHKSHHLLIPFVIFSFLIVASMACGSLASTPAPRISTATIEVRSAPTKLPETTQPTASIIQPPPPVAILPFDYQEVDVGDGWKIGVVRLYFLNASDQPVPPESLHVAGITVETLEHKTYPAALLDPSRWPESSQGHRVIPDNFTSLMKKGTFNWWQPEAIFLGGAAVGGRLYIPSHFPFYTVPAGFGRYEYGIGFRFAAAANPVRIVLQIPPYEDTNLDLTVAKPAITDPNPSEVNARPIAELAGSFIVDNENFKFTWDGECVFRIEEMVRNKMVYLPYTLVNKNSLDEQRVVLEFPHAIYRPGGILDYCEEPIERTIGPGQTMHDLYLIDLLISEDDPLPLYLVHYEGDNVLKMYQLNCTEAR